MARRTSYNTKTVFTAYFTTMTEEDIKKNFKAFLASIMLRLFIYRAASQIDIIPLVNRMWCKKSEYDTWKMPEG